MGLRVLIGQALDHLAVFEGGLDDLRNIFGGDVLVGDLLGSQQDLHRPGAEALAAAFLQGDLAFQAAFLEFLPKGGGHLIAAHGQAAGTGADQHLRLLGV